MAHSKVTGTVVREPETEAEQMTSVDEHATLRVLIAEDDQGLRESLERVLRFEGYGVLLAKDGAEALDVVDHEDPDLLVLDIMMPHVDGLSACRMLRQRGSALPILMLTARHTVSDRVDGLDAGADDYLVKPFAIDELLARVRRAAPAAAADRLGRTAPGRGSRPRPGDAPRHAGW